MSQGYKSNISFDTVINVSAKDTWNVIFTEAFDKYYAPITKTVTTIPIYTQETDQSIIREVKVLPNVGSFAQVFISAISILIKVDKSTLSYVSKQEKFKQQKDDHYRMEFETYDYSVKLDYLKNNGVIIIKQDPNDQNKCIMTTKMYFETFFPIIPYVYNPNDTFATTVKNETKLAFEKMVECIPKFLQSQ